MSECLGLKWGTLKYWDFGENERALAAYNKWFYLGSCTSAMAQNNTPEQKELICEIIDAINGPIKNDWSGEEMTKDEAKKYVMEYRS